MSVVFAGTKRKLENSHAPARTDRPYLAPIRALAPVFRSPQAILRRARKTGPEGKSLPTTKGMPVTIAASDCPERVDAHPQAEDGATTNFSLLLS